MFITCGCHTSINPGGSKSGCEEHYPHTSGTSSRRSKGEQLLFGLLQMFPRWCCPLVTVWLSSASSTVNCPVSCTSDQQIWYAIHKSNKVKLLTGGGFGRGDAWSVLAPIKGRKLLIVIITTIMIMMIIIIMIIKIMEIHDTHKLSKYTTALSTYKSNSFTNRMNQNTHTHTHTHAHTRTHTHTHTHTTHTHT